jgi:hypothetical protein
MKTAILSAMLLLSGCATHVSYLSDFEAGDDGGDGVRDAGAEGALDAGEGRDGAAACAPGECDAGVDGGDAAPTAECEPGETRACESPGCDDPSTCGELQRCGEDGRWLSCSECPPGIDVPTPEVLGDGVDNDCDGEVDECDGADEGCGCDAECVPGATRWCEDPSYCSWGQQVCGETGLWDRCWEAAMPEACSSFAWLSPQAEACVIDAGECIQDFWDLDEDGDTWESIGPGCEPAPCP